MSPVLLQLVLLPYFRHLSFLAMAFTAPVQIAFYTDYSLHQVTPIFLSVSRNFCSVCSI